MADPAQEGTWSTIGLSGVVGMHASLMHTGHVHFFCRPERISHRAGARDCGFETDGTLGPLDPDLTLSSLFPVAGSEPPRPVATPVEHNPFCAGHTHLADGSLIVAGGDKRGNSIAEGDIDYAQAPLPTKFGLDGLQVYTPTGISSGFWTTAGTISDNRWYPTCVLLGDGSVLVLSGSIDDQDTNDANLNPTCERLPPLRSGPQFLPPLMEAWPYHSYPSTYLLPSGDIFMFARCSGHYLTPRAAGSELGEGFDIRPGPKLPQGEPAKHYPNNAAVLLLPLKPEADYRSEVLIVGGSSTDRYHQWGDDTHNIAASARAFRTVVHPPGEDEFQAVADMANPRIMPDAVLLPDGKVLVVNGARAGYAGGDAATGPAIPHYGVLEAELFDPADNSWQALAKAKNCRLYHSTALLLPDATVLVAGNDHRYVPNRAPSADAGAGPGGGQPAGPIKLLEAASAPHLAECFDYDVEIFRPPYLCTGQSQLQLEPEKTSLRYGEELRLRFSGAERASGDPLTAALIRPGSVTHNNNMGQRFVGLEVVATDDGEATLRMPPDANVAPPGYYMLFLVDRGVPSHAAFVQLLLDQPAGAPPELADRATALWLRADRGVMTDSRNHVVSWYDLSGSGQHMYWQPNPQKDGRELRALLLPEGMNGRACVRLRLASSLNYADGFQLDMSGGFFKTLREDFLHGSAAHSIFIILHVWPGGPRGLGGVFGWGNFASDEGGVCVGLRFSRSPRREGSEIPARAGYAGFDVYRSGAHSSSERAPYPSPDCEVPMTRPVLLEVRVAGGLTTCWPDGEQLSDCAAPFVPTGAGPALLGATGAEQYQVAEDNLEQRFREYFRGDIAEIIVFDGEPDEARDGAVRSYLRERYRLDA